MKRTALLLLALAGLSLAACAPRAPDPERFSAKFFEHGKEAIIDALEDQKVDEAQIATARSILHRHQPNVIRATTSAMRAQQELMLALASGGNSATLLRLDAEQNRTQEQALRTIGSMHEELESTVGAEKWRETSARLEKKYRRYFKHRQ